MRRREFLGLAGATAVFPRVALGQQGRLPHIAFLWAPGMPRAYIVQYQEGLSDYGYVDGRTAIVQTFAAMTIADLPAVAAQAATSGADVIVVNENTVATTLKRFTQ